MNRGKNVIRYCRVHVSGRVQGVGFRMATRAEARRLGLRGYAENLSDGRVEVLMLGENEAVRALLGWLEQGPPAAYVSDVKRLAVGPVPEELPAGFEIR